MPDFVTLPSGLVLNLGLIRRVAPSEQHGQAALSVYFANGDFTILDSADSEVLAKRLGANLALSSNVKTAIFWLVIVLAIVLVWAAIHR